MEIIKKYSVLSVFVLVVFAGIVYFFYHFGDHDAQALTDFSLAYASFDKSISDFSTAVLATDLNNTTHTDNLELNAHIALVNLSSKAAVRISSLTVNDAELMSITQEIAQLSGKELDALMAYKIAITENTIDAEKLARELEDLTNKRKTDYARFRELSGL